MPIFSTVDKNNLWSLSKKNQSIIIAMSLKRKLKFEINGCLARLVSLSLLEDIFKAEGNE